MIKVIAVLFCCCGVVVCSAGVMGAANCTDDCSFLARASSALLGVQDLCSGGAECAPGDECSAGAACAPGAHASAATACADDQGCADEPASDFAFDRMATSAFRFTPEQRKAMVDHVLDLTAHEDEDARFTLSVTDIGAAAGLELTRADTTAVLDVLREEGILKGGGRCADYGACSIYGDLGGAADDVLAMYHREKTLDGADTGHAPMPPFTALRFDGAPVSTQDWGERPVLLTTLAVHCRHSYDTIPLLAELAARHGREVEIVAILVNSGSVEDVNQSLQDYSFDHPVWVAEGDALSEVLGTHLVPTHHFIDPQGRLTERFVGFKDGDTLQGAVERLLAAD